MQPLQINVQVTIGVSQELNGLLAMLTKSLPAAPAPGVAVAAPETKTEAAPQPVVTAPAEDPAPAADPEPVKEKPLEQKAGSEKREYTEVDVRAAMDALRKRIEGENYKENPDSEGYKKWHRVLTVWFKNTAAICGAEKPSALPDNDSRQSFIKCCEEVYVNDAGELVGDYPF